MIEILTLENEHIRTILAPARAMAGSADSIQSIDEKLPNLMFTPQGRSDGFWRCFEGAA